MNAEDYLRGEQAEGGLEDATIQALIDERLAARAAKNFAKSDEIRDALLQQGIVLEDGAGVTRWRRV